MSVCKICGHEIIWSIYEDMCLDCADKYVKCEYSGKYVLKTDATHVYRDVYLANDEVEAAIASGQFWRCDDCGYIKRAWDEKYYTYDNKEICYDCRAGLYKSCYECGELFPLDDMTYDEFEYRWYCADCDKRRSRHVIREYGHKPKYKFKTGAHDEFETDDDITELMFGVELEIDHGNNREDCAADIVDASDDIYCKYDGSLEEGVEIVTHPCSLSYHREELGWEGVCRTALDYDFESHYAGTCGLHIHVGRKQLRDEHGANEDNIAKVILLVDRHWDNMVTFSRRTEEQLDEWAAKPYINYYNADERDLIENTLGTADDGRYQAVNLQNRGTIEFRLYRGSLREETILASLELTSNICKYAMSHSVEEVLASQWEDIISIEEFAELRSYVKKSYYRDYIKPRKLRERPEGERRIRSSHDLREGDRVIVARAAGQERREIANHLLNHTARVVRLSHEEGLDVLLDFGEFLDCTHHGDRFDEPHYYWLNHSVLDFAE